MDGERQVRLLETALGRCSEGTVLERVVGGAAEMLEVSSVTCALMTDQLSGPAVAASDVTGRAVFDLEFELGEGPGVTAFESGAEVLCPDLEADASRWPAFCAAAAERGIRAAFAFPARIGAIRLGIVVAHRDEAGPLAPAGLDDARVFTEICGTLMLDEQNGIDGAASIAAGWVSRAVVHQATGMVAVQLGSGLPAALARLRALAYVEGRALDDVATDIVERRLRIEP